MVVSKDQTLARSEQEYRKDEYIEDITQWHEDVNFIFERQNNIKYCFCYEKIKFIPSTRRVMFINFVTFYYIHKKTLIK